MKLKLKKFLLPVVAATLSLSVLTGCGKTYSATKMLETVNYNVDDYVKLCDLSSIDTSEVSKPQEITDKDAVQYLKTQLSNTPKYKKSKHEKIVEGDVANIDYVGKIDNKKISEASDENYYLTIGSGSFIEGFESGLVGHSAGETVTLDLTFPETYGDADLAGKAVTFTVKINGIYDAKYYTVDNVPDEFISKQFGSDTKEKYLKKLKEDLTNYSESMYTSNLQQTVITYLTENSQISIPKGLVNDQVVIYKANLKKAAEENNQTLDEYIKENTGENSFEDYKSDLTASARESVEQDLIMQALMKKYNTKIKESDFQDFVQKYIESYNYSVEDFYSLYGGEAKTRLSYAESVAFNQLIDDIKNGKDQTNPNKSSNDSGSAKSSSSWNVTVGSGS